MDQIMSIMLLIVMTVVGWTVYQKDMRVGRLTKRPVPVEKDRIEKRKVL